MYRQQELIHLLENRHILIAGYGREGKSTHALIERLLPDMKVDIACNDEEIYAALDKSRYDLIIKSPGISTMKFEGRCDLDTITSQTDLFLQVYHDHTIGITGTKGKSTTTTLIHHVLTHALPKCHVILAGNMGIPLFDIVDEISESCYVVAEFSCHQLENIHRSPHISVLLNLFQEHLDHYHSYRDYQMAKMQIALNQQDPHDICFFGVDSNDLRTLLTDESIHITSRTGTFSLDDALNAGVDKLTTTLKGQHNITNIYVAQLVAETLNISSNEFATALATFHGLPHRLELVGTYKNITFYNDSISTIPEAAIAAIQALQKVDTIILGGFDRGIDYSPLCNFLTEHQCMGIHNFAFVGQAGRRMLQEWEHSGSNPLQGRNILVEDDYSVIVPWCFDHTEAGKICLLSPAAASYDAFKNFEQRGEVYKELILKNSK